MLDRPLYRNTWKELTKENRMVFMEGARRVGKTTLGEMIAESFANHEYLSWEIPEHRARLIREPAFFEAVERRNESIPFIMFDEINKHRGWRKYLKGVYDRVEGDYQFLVAGSSRLDYARGVPAIWKTATRKPAANWLDCSPNRQSTCHAWACGPARLMRWRKCSARSGDRGP